jgi:acyl-CoA-binding protein
MNQTSLDIQFKEAYKVISELSQDQFAPDLMLKIYAYYKQATYGDNNPEYIETNEIDLRNGFKLNAWIQLRGMSVENAKKEYIKIANNI